MTGALAILLIMSGCAGLDTGEVTTEPGIDTGEDTTEQSETMSSSPTESESQSDTPVGTGYVPEKRVKFANYYNSSMTLSVTITHRDSNTTVFENETTLAPDKTIKFDPDFSREGEYQIVATSNNTTIIETWRPGESRETSAVILISSNGELKVWITAT